MADAKTPGGTQAISNTPELDNLKERETALVTELARLEKMDHNKASQGGHDISEVKRRTQINLTEIRKAIQEAKK